LKFLNRTWYVPVTLRPLSRLVSVTTPELATSTPTNAPSASKKRRPSTLPTSWTCTAKPQEASVVVPSYTSEKGTVRAAAGMAPNARTARTAAKTNVERTRWRCMWVAPVLD